MNSADADTGFADCAAQMAIPKIRHDSRKAEGASRQYFLDIHFSCSALHTGPNTATTASKILITGVRITGARADHAFDSIV
jgi:hypothetical protein